MKLLVQDNQIKRLRTSHSQLQVGGGIIEQVSLLVLSFVGTATQNTNVYGWKLHVGFQ